MSVHIEVYTRPGCQPCEATKRWLRNHDKPFTELDATDYAAFLRLDLGHQTAPVVVIYRDGAHVTDWSGYRPENLREATA